MISGWKATENADQRSVMLVGLALTAIWAVLLLIFWLLFPVGNEVEHSGFTRLLIMVGILMPFILIWVAVTMSHVVTGLRRESRMLRVELDQLTQLAKTPPKPAAAADTAEPGIATATRRPAPLPSRRAKPPTKPPEQTSMQFDTPEPTHVAAGTLVLALNFPDDANDHETISALRIALKDPETARVLRAAQDVVTLLAEQGVFMDDLPPNHASPEIWRQFAEGDRGRSAARIGGIHDAEALEIVSELLRGDEIFRDTAHHFLRHFDTLLTRNIAQLDDPHIHALADTRSARSFMLIGRAAGVFGHRVD